MSLMLKRPNTSSSMSRFRNKCPDAATSGTLFIGYHSSNQSVPFREDRSAQNLFGNTGLNDVSFKSTTEHGYLHSTHEELNGWIDCRCDSYVEQGMRNRRHRNASFTALVQIQIVSDLHSSHRLISVVW